MSCIVITSAGAAEAAAGAEAEEQGDYAGDGDSDEAVADYDNTSGNDHTCDTRADDANRCSVREERENQNQDPVKKAAQARGLDN